MADREKYYRNVVEIFQKDYGVTEEELLKVFRAWEDGNEEELKKLCDKHNQPLLKNGYVHFAVAYRLYLREQGKL